MSRKTVLIVEDDPDIRFTLQQVIEMEGYQVWTSQHGADALDLIRHEKTPHLILLDLMMPVMTGWEFLTVRQDRPDLLKIPVIVISAAADRSQEMDVQQVSGYLRKPLDIEVLLQRIKQVAEA